MRPDLDDADAAPPDPHDPARVIVTDTGFHRETAPADVLDLAPGTDPARVGGLDHAPLIRIAFPVFSDGRGFSLAVALRRAGYAGRLRAAGHVLADQYAMARRCGFDEVEIDAALAARQPEAHWLARADWRAHDLRAGLRPTEDTAAGPRRSAPSAAPRPSPDPDQGLHLSEALRPRP